MDAGSRMHFLDWVGSQCRDFVASLNELIEVTGVRVSRDDYWMPRNRAEPDEALLTKPCEPLLCKRISAALRSWWLAVDHRQANEPNWDLAVRATFPGGRPGLILAEGKAHVGELKGEEKGKNANSNPDNHASIGKAIGEVRDALGGESAGVRISRDTHYQFSNRIAFAWKLAHEGVPCVLVYLGFTGDTEIAPGYLRDGSHWQEAVAEHIRPVFPEGGIDRKFCTAKAPFWFLVRSLECCRPSPPVGSRSPVRSGPRNRTPDAKHGTTG